MGLLIVRGGGGDEHHLVDMCLELLEVQGPAERTNFDIEMLRETGFCSGIENYSRHLNAMPEGAPPLTLMDFFPDDFLIIIDESHGKMAM